jgi:hypothetical protein
LTHIDNIPNLFQLVECHDLLEVIEERIASWGMWEVSDGSRAWPGDDRGENNADENGTADTVHDQKQSEESMLS